MTQQALFAEPWRWRHLVGTSSARFSPCPDCLSVPSCRCGSSRRFRYELRRSWDPTRRPLVAILCNPSKAGETEDDPTCRRLYAFADRWGHGGLVLLNAFALRSTNPAALRLAAKSGLDPIGPDNDATIRTVLEQHKESKLLLAWGVNAKLLDRGRDVAAMAVAIHGRPECFGLTDNGQPNHPLYLPDESVPHLYTTCIAEAS